MFREGKGMTYNSGVYFLYSNNYIFGFEFTGEGQGSTEST